MFILVFESKCKTPTTTTEQELKTFLLPVERGKKFINFEEQETHTEINKVINCVFV